MVFRRQIIGANKIVWVWLIRMFLLPLLIKWVVNDVLTHPVPANHCKIINWFYARRNSGEQTGSTGRCLGKDDSVTDTILTDFFLGLFRKSFYKQTQEKIGKN